MVRIILKKYETYFLRTKNTFSVLFTSKFNKLVDFQIRKAESLTSTQLPGQIQLA